MTSDDAGYYRGRVAVEREMARQAANPYARRAHQQLADNYELLCRLLSAQPLPPARPQPMLDGVGFITLFQNLAMPSSAQESGFL